MILTHKTYLALVALLFLAAFLRLYRLPDLMPFIADQGKDYLVAKEIVETGQLPLLGIESSVPRFHQGPVYAWLTAGALWLGQFDPVFPAFMAAALGILTVGGTFLLVERRWGLLAAIVAGLILATSPLAVTQSRLAFHTNAIPVTSVIFLWSLLRWYEKSLSTFFVGLSWALLFQFELVVVPLLLLIPLVWYLKRQPITFKSVSLLVAGISVGLLPQIIYDLTHGFEQLGVFGVWIGYRLVSFVQPGSEHTASLAKLIHVAQRVVEYIQKFFSWWHWGPTMVITTAIAGISLAKRPVATRPTSLILYVWLGLMLVGYIIMGNASEAYFPVLFVPLAIFVGICVSWLNTRSSQAILVLGVACVALINSYALVDSHFFTAKPTKSKLNPYNTYGPPLRDQVSLMDQVAQLQTTIKILSDDPGYTLHDSYLDNYYYLAEWLEIEIDMVNGLPVWINHHPSPIKPGTMRFTSGKITLDIPYEF